MKFNWKSSLALAGIFALIGGCSFNIQKYEHSDQNVRVIRNLAPLAKNKIKLGEFTALKPGRSSLYCRMTAPVETPGEVPFETYIRSAFLTELRMSDLYSEKYGVEVTGSLLDIGFKSSPGKGHWAFRMEISSPESDSFVVEYRYEFKTYTDPDKSCWQVARAFVPAVRGLIRAVIEHPDFRTKILGIPE
ncbi:MAG: hypothetical protein JRH05_11340 [Deltaproteobacteria bacterium]|nr:hypothetical protein [Deltaproteobacteria bacterium]MBW2103246.1 hypothetical protein [Deltaproteobacteria bacterium]